MVKARLPASVVEAAKPKMVFKRSKKGANLSRKQIFEAHRKAWEVKQKKLDLVKQEAKRQRVEQVQKQHNKKANKAFDRSILRAVQEGLTSAITALGEQVTPLSLFMGAYTALAKSPEKHQVPYMLAILSACIPRLSQGVILNRLESLFSLCEQLIAENATSNHLITTKAMKVAQTVLLSVERPNMEIVRQFRRLEPSKIQVDLMQLYLASFRKLLEQSALCSSDASYAIPVKDPQSESYKLNPLQLFYVEALPEFVNICVNNLTDAPTALATSTLDELSQVFSRSLSPYIVESREGRQLIDNLLSNQLVSFLKPVYQRFWGVALGVLEVFGSRVSYVKRVRSSLLFTQRFPAAVFLLKVLNKLRGMDDTTLNGKIERTMAEFGKGMSVKEFVEILPFDPRKAYAAEMGYSESTDADGEDASAALWATSYTLNVLRRIASHDSLPFFVDYFFPMIQFCSKVSLEAERAGRPEEFTRWSALLVQLWRVAVGFCHYPVEVTNNSFRDLAKQLIGLLASDSFVDTSATAIHVLCDGYYRLSQAEQLDDDDDGVAVAAAAGDDTEMEVLEGDMRAGTSYGGATAAKRRRALRKDALDEDDTFLSMNDSEWNPHRYHNISQAYATEVCTTVFAKYSVNVMPKLCNVFETHDSTAVLLAIQSFSKVCKPEVMTTILNGILEVGSNIAARASAGSSSVKAGNAPLTSKRRMVLDIACAVVAQLPAEHVTRLFNDVIEPVLMDPAPESRLLQKKAYKLLFSLFEDRVKDVFPLFPRIVGILSVGRQHVTISGIKMRVRCLSWSLDACKMYYPDELATTIRSLVPEIVLFSRERSSETRSMTMDVLEKMQRYMLAAGAPSNALLHLVVAGLSGKTPMMMSSALVCMAKLVYLTHQELPEADLCAAVALGFKLMESSMIEVRTAAAIFARMALKLMKRSRAVGVAVERALPSLLFSIALITSQPHVSSTTRVQMRVLLEKCIKRCGYSRIDPLFPLGSKNFLRYTDKMMRREEKKEEKELKKRKEAQQNEFDKLFLGASMKAGAEDGNAEDLLEAGALTSFVSKHTAPNFKGFSGSGGANENDNEEDDYDTMHLDFQEGNLRIISKDEKQREDEQKRRQATADKLLRRNNGIITGETINDTRSRPGKRSRDEADAEDLENEELNLRYGSKATEDAAKRATATYMGSGKAGSAVAAALRRGGSGNVVGPSENQISKLRDQKAIKQALKRQRVEEDIRKGDEFQGTGTGDVKRGNIEPYAYVPLNRRYMNRRNARQALHRFEVVSNKHLKGEKAKAMDLAKKR